jgi:hypothetical protein
VRRGLHLFHFRATARQTSCRLSMGLKLQAHVMARRLMWAADPGGPVNVFFLLSKVPCRDSLCLRRSVSVFCFPFHPKATPISLLDSSKQKLAKCVGKQDYKIRRQLHLHASFSVHIKKINSMKPMSCLCWAIPAQARPYI